MNYIKLKRYFLCFLFDTFLLQVANNWKSFKIDFLKRTKVPLIHYRYFILWNCSEQWFIFWSLLYGKKIKYSSVIFLLQNLWRGKRIFKLFFISLCFLNLSDKFTSDIVFFCAYNNQTKRVYKAKVIVSAEPFLFGDGIFGLAPVSNCYECKKTGPF